MCQNIVTIPLPADFTTFSSLATVAQGGSTGATRSCSQGPSEKPASRPGSKSTSMQIFWEVQSITRRLLAKLPLLWIWHLDIRLQEHTEHVDMLKRMISADASYICTSAVRFRPTLRFIHHQMTHFFHIFFRHCCWWTTTVEIIFNALSTSFEELNPHFDTPVGKINFPRCCQQVFTDNRCHTFL